MAGYSPTPQARKLGLKPGLRVALDDSPANWALVDPPEVRFVSGVEQADVVVCFVRSAADIEGHMDAAAQRIFPAGALWIAWPRRAAGHRSDVTENDVRAAALPRGVVDVKVAAIDDDWSGLKIVWRREERQKRS